jgi:hypothetical protein
MAQSISRARIVTLAVMAAIGAATGGAAASCTTPTATAAVEQTAVEYAAPTATWADQVDLTDRDIQFLAALNNQGIEYMTPGTAVTAALAVCLLRTGGAEVGAARIAAGVTSWNPTGAGFFTGAATAVYCPTEQVGGAR